MNPRPDPDQLLKRLQEEDVTSRGGRLKLFFGASPGVGKTYAMLESAQQRRKEGVRVLVGLVETHGRDATARLLDGLDILPRKTTTYRGIQMQEFDLEAALERKPSLIIVDELAHTNAPGSRHNKRWQDVEELLHAGIDVYTTMNVQHWETLNDVVEQITGVAVRETVPDKFLENAHDVELVDLPPDELLKRLKEGKIYMGALAGRAAENFFKPGNLIALRELALRHVAAHVEEQMRVFKERNADAQTWRAGERLLVGVSTGPMSIRLVRATARIAAQLHAEWIVANVETPSSAHLSEEEKNNVAKALSLAQELGAQTTTLAGDNVTNELLTYARARHVTKIVLGKPARPRWREWIQGSVINNMARQANDLDLYVISGIGDMAPVKRPAKRPQSIRAWVWSVSIVLLETLICWLLSKSLDRTNLAMVYMAGIVWIAYFWGRRPALLSSVLSVLCFDFFFVSPTFSFTVSDTEYLVTFAVMLAVGVVISTIAGRLKSQTQTLRKRNLETEALYNLSRVLSETPNPRDLLRIAEEHLAEFYEADVHILIGNSHSTLEKLSEPSAETFLSPRELATARWVYDNGQKAGAGTETLGGAEGLYLPLKGVQSVVGVLAIKADWTKNIDPEREHLLETFASEIGGALESTRLSEAAGRVQAQVETERLKNMILQTFSIEVISPLEKIETQTQKILTDHPALPPQTKTAIQTIIEEASKLRKISLELPDLLSLSEKKTK